MSHDTWLHRLARPAVRRLATTPVTPNHLTTARLLTGLAAGALFAVGSLAAVYWGAALFLLSMLLDRADGDLARLTGKTTPWGHSYDLCVDAIANTAVFVGIGIGARAGLLGWWGGLMGLAAGVAVVGILWLILRIENIRGRRGAELGSFLGFDPDDTLLLLPLILCLGGREPLLVASALGAPLFWAFMAWRFRGLDTAAESTRPRARHPLEDEGAGVAQHLACGRMRHESARPE